MSIPIGDLAKINGLSSRIINMVALFDSVLQHNHAQAAVFLNEAVMAQRELALLSGRLEPPVTLSVLEGVAEAATAVMPPPEPPEEPEGAA